MLRSALICFVAIYRSALALRGGARIYRSALMCAGLLLLSACSQGENDPCQIDSDCDSGLICVRARAAERGTCENPKTLQDAGILTTDSGTTPLPDAGNEDGGSEDSGAAKP
jgi:hypothetical protein